MIGDRYFGLAGALSALAGMLTFPLLIALALVAVVGSAADAPVVQGALHGIAAVAAGLIGATGLKLITALKTNVIGQWVCWAVAVASFVAIAIFHVPLVWVLLGIGGAACVWAYWQLGRVAQASAAKGSA